MGDIVSAELNTTEVDLSGLLQVLGGNLYSMPEVAVRELIQNAHDACVRRRLEGEAFEPRIIVGASPTSGRLWIEDNGAGLTPDEVRRYLATIGAGYTRTLRASPGGGDLIGAFGLGFLSAYMIARRVEVVSTHHTTPDEGVRFVSDSGRTYALEAVPPRAIGSRIEVELNETSRDLADFEALAAVVRAHCRLLEIPVTLEWSGEVVNDRRPPWRQDLAQAPAVRLRRERLAFAKDFETVFEPICTLPIARTEEGDAGEGLVWLHDSGLYGSGDNRRLAVYVRGMRVCANERDLLPSWATFLSGVFESDVLSPTTSREDVQRNAAYDAARTQIAREIAGGLVSLARDEPEAWRRVLRRHNESLLGAAIADYAVFEAMQDELTLPTSHGDLAAGEIAKRSGGRLLIAMSRDHGADTVLARALNLPVIDGLRYGAATFAARWAEMNGVGVTRLGTAGALAQFFPPATAPADEVAALQAWLGADAALRLTRFQPASLPLLIVRDEEAATKAYLESDEADAKLGAGVLAMARLFAAKVESSQPRTIVVNLDCPAVAATLAARGTARGEAGAKLLGAMAGLLAPASDADGAEAYLAALAQFSAAATSLLGDSA